MRKRSTSRGIQKHPIVFQIERCICHSLLPFLGKTRGVQEVVASLYFHTAIGRFCRAETRIAAWSRVGKFCHRLLLRDVTDGTGGSWPRVAPIFYLECIADRRPSNWLHRRFHRVKLPRPLKTSLGDPCGRAGNSEGGRTAPNVRQVKQRRLAPLSLSSNVVCYVSLGLGGG